LEEAVIAVALYFQITCKKRSMDHRVKRIALN